MRSSANLILVGPTGAGKSTIGKRLAGYAGLRFVDLDREVEMHAGASIATIFACEGEAGFRRREHDMLRTLLRHDGQLLATGGGTVLAPENRTLLRTRGFVVHLYVDLTQQFRRLARDRDRPLLRRADREQALRALARHRAPLYADVADLYFDTSAHTPDSACTALSTQLSRCWRRVAGEA